MFMERYISHVTGGADSSKNRAEEDYGGFISGVEA
jgi:hypothetical protein